MKRSILECTSNVYHQLLNKGQSNELEGIQKRSLRIIYGYDYDYQQLLELSGLETLQLRREKSFEKFTRKIAKNPKYMHWFPVNPTERLNRNTAPYKEEKSVGNRLYKSPIYAMRRLLNNSTSLDQIDLTGLFNAPQLALSYRKWITINAHQNNKRTARTN